MLTDCLLSGDYQSEMQLSALSGDDQNEYHSTEDSASPFLRSCKEFESKPYAESTFAFESRPLLWSLLEWFLIGVLFGASLFLQYGNTVHPHIQYIPGQIEGELDLNYRFGYSIEDSTVPTFMSIMLCFVVWMLLSIVFGVRLYCYYGNITCIWRPWWRLNDGLVRMILFAFSTNLLMTDILKNCIGQPRPHFNAVYEQYVNGEITEYEMDDVRRSFVSGHSSNAWCLMSLITICMINSYLNATRCFLKGNAIGTLEECNGYFFFLVDIWYKLVKCPLVAMLVLLCPIYWALYVSMTRIKDYKHTAEDVIGGALVGIACSFVSYMVYRRKVFLEKGRVHQ